MTTEIRMLAWSIVLGFVYVFVAAYFATSRRGLAWNVGNRDGSVSALEGPGARAQRANRNFLESFAFFAAAVLAITALHAGTARTALGAQLYFWARLVYLPVYIIGVPYLRSLVWAISFAGIVMVLGALL